MQMRSASYSLLVAFFANIAPILSPTGAASNRVQNSIPFLQIFTSGVLIEIFFYFLVILLLSLSQVLISILIFNSSFGKEATEKHRAQGTLLIALLITLTFYFLNFVLQPN